MSLEKRSEPYRPRNLQWIRFKFFTLSLLDRFPLLKGPVIRIWRTGKWLLLKYRWKLETMLSAHNNEFDTDKMYWVSPRRIEYCSLKEFDIYRYKEKVIGGGWDCLEKKFEQLDVYVALKEVCVNGRDWKETSFYQRLLDRLTKGEILWGCKNKFELDKRCGNLKSLFRKIKSEGYKTQVELSSLEKTYNPIKREDEITVSVGRFGDLLFSNGAHRLAIAKLLNIEKIPVRIAVRHPQWVNFRREILLYAKNHGGKIYQLITHPDLSDMPAFHKSEDRYQIIVKNLSPKSGRLLDIGANWGYFCHKFEDEGFDCYAVENDKTNIYFLKKIKRAENKKFKIITASILERQGIKNLEFEVVLALNIFHHFLKKKADYLDFLNFLKNLKMKEIFFEPHLSDELQMKDAYKNYPNEEFVEFILENSILNYAKCIGEAKDGRKIYKLY